MSTTTKLTLGDLLAALDTGGPAVDAAAAITHAILTEHLDIAEQLVYPAVYAQVVRRRRLAARRAENEAFAGARPQPAGPAAAQGTAPPADAPAADPLAPLRALRDAAFWIPDDGMVTWAEATAAQHQARAAYIRDRYVTPMLADIDRHTLAAAIISTAGVHRLAEVPGY
jgi:hypothetical protein